MKDRYGLNALAALLILGAGVLPAAALSQAPATSETSLTGTWEIAVQTRGRLGRPEVLTLRQNADGSFSGAFIVESRRSEEPILDGRIESNAFTFARESIEAQYEGTIDGDRITGTMTQPSGNQVFSYTFSATRTSVDVISFATPAESTPEPENPPAGGAPSPRRVQVPPPGEDPVTPTPTAASPSPTQAAAAPTQCMLGCVGEGELTIDGEALSLTFTQCRVLARESGMWSGNASSELGTITISVSILQPPIRHLAQIILPNATYTANFAQEADGWTRETRDDRRIFRVPALGPLVTHDATDVTASGTFMHDTEWTDHEIELRLSCRSA